MFRFRRGGSDFIRNGHQDLICNALERTVLGLCPRLIINVPPRTGKSEIAVVNFISWAMGLFPDSEFIHTSYSSGLAATNTFSARSIMQTEAYQEVFPWTAFRRDSNARDHFRTAQGGVVYSTGSEGGITGYGAGKMRDGFGGAILIDDPHKAGEARSDVKRQKIIDWFSETLESRKNRRETPIILIMQRLHDEDLSGFLLAGGNGETWEHLCIPAIQEDGTSFWEAQFPVEDLSRREIANPYVYSGQYQQRPTPKGGGMFPVDRFDIVDEPPRPADIKDTLRYWDKAGTKDGGAFTAGVLMHLLKNGMACIEHVYRKQVGALDRERDIKHQAEVDGRRIRISIEQEPGSGGKESAESTIRNLAGWVVTADRPVGDKDARAEPYAAQVQAGNVQIVRAAWNRAFLDEHELFPLGKFKDQVDASAAAFNLLNVAKRATAVSVPIRGLI